MTREAKTLAPGTVLGGEYEVVRLLASGGMGAVYVAQQRSTQKLRALKTMLPRFVSDPGMRARFAREATAGAHIESDHVVEVLAAGIDDALGIPWIAMELLAGDDLAKTVAERGPLPLAAATELLRQLGHALAAAHRGGVVHRDLKPENIFLAKPRREGEPFTVKVLDFGIAKLLHGSSPMKTTSALGSPVWMSPEQTDAELPKTPATDVWSAALITFWILTGRYYWLVAEDPKAPMPLLLRELLVDALPPASVRAAALGVGDRIPPGFDAWFTRCLARDASQRFRDAGEAFPPLVALLTAAASARPPAPAMPATMALSQAEIAAHVARAVVPAQPAAFAAPQPFAPTPAPRGSAAKIVVGVAVLTAVVAAAAWAITHRSPAPRPSPAGTPGVATTAPPGSLPAPLPPIDPRAGLAPPTPLPGALPPGAVRSPDEEHRDHDHDHDHDHDGVPWDVPILHIGFGDAGLPVPVPAVPVDAGPPPPPTPVVVDAGPPTPDPTPPPPPPPTPDPAPPPPPPPTPDPAPAPAPAPAPTPPAS